MTPNGWVRGLDRIRKDLLATGARLVRTLLRSLQGLTASLRALQRYYIPIDIKFALAIAVVIGGSMGVLGFTILRNQRDLIHVQIARLGHASVGQLAESSREPLLAGDDLRMELLVTSILREEGLQGAALLDPQSRVVFGQGDLPAAGTFSDDGETDTGMQDWRQDGRVGGEPDRVTFRRAVRFGETLVGQALVTFDRAALNTALLRSRRAIYSATAVMILFGLVLSVVVGRRLSRPIHELIAMSSAIEEGDLEARFKGQRRDEVGRLMNSFNQMAEGLLAKSQVEDVFSRYVPAQVARRLLADLREVKLGGSRVMGTVLFADIAGFTELSEGLEPDAVAELINDYFSTIPRIAAAYGGSVDKYIGDEAMLVFGVPDPDPSHCFHAVAAAVLFQRAAERVSRRRAAAALPTVTFKIGVNTGLMLAGNMGSADHMQFTVVGDSVNLASRLCSMAAPGQVVISQAVHDCPEVRDGVMFLRHKSMKLHGIKNTVMTFLVRNLRTHHRAELEGFLEELFPLPGGDGDHA